MELFTEVLIKFWLPILTTVATALVRIAMARRPRLITYLSHSSAIPLINLPRPVAPPAVAQPGALAPAPQPAAAPAGPPQQAAPAAAPAPQAAPAQNVPPFVLHTHSILVRNVGNKTAFNVRIGHNAANVFGHQVSPAMAHRITPIPGGGWEILIPTLVADESVQVAYIYPSDVLWSYINSQTKSDEGPAEYLNVAPTLIPSAARRTVRAVFFYLGVFAFAYLVFLFLEQLYAFANLITGPVS